MICPICFDPGKPLAAETTPTFVSMTLLDFTPGEFFDPDFDQLLLTPHMLTQTLIPCEWSQLDGTFLWLWAWRPGGTNIQVLNLVNSSRAFLAFGQPNCLLEYSDDNSSAPGNIAFGGTATLSLTLESIQ